MVDNNEPIAFESDSHQWVWDLAIQQTGRVQHFFESRQLPAAVHTFAMASKHMASAASRMERLGRAEAAVGHDRTALGYYFDAAAGFARAQHNYSRDCREKRLLHGRSVDCYDRIRDLSSTSILRVEVPFEAGQVTGYLHLAPGSGRAPLVFFLPGIDMTKETVPPHALGNWATQRGMHMFVFDGPGQGESNMTGMTLDHDNYERAVAAAVSVLLEREEIDGEHLLLYGMSFASYWAVRAAAFDNRFSAAVFQWASVADMQRLFNGAVSPRYKHVLAYITGSSTESEVDDFVAGMGLGDLPSAVDCPTLTTVGEFDQRSPLDEVYEFFDSLATPGEMWVFADQHHMLSLRGKSNPMSTALDSHDLGMDWLRDRADGNPLSRPGDVVYLESGGPSPNDPDAPSARYWYE